jgi:prepilin-type N-terminal cleavage/methylation domain-containing protein
VLAGPLGARGPRAASGFTLVEVVVVLIVLGLGAALVAPALTPQRTETPASLGKVVAHVQDLAARRGETLLLQVSPGGTWAAFGTASPEQEPLGTGALHGPVPGPGPGHGFSLRVDPLGSCGLTLEADTLAWQPPVDPLTCRPIAP